LCGARTGRVLCIAAIRFDLFEGCHRDSDSPTVAVERGRFRGLGREVIEGEGRREKMFGSMMEAWMGRGADEFLEVPMLPDRRRACELYPTRYN
jgi:hypothetical protein